MPDDTTAPDPVTAVPVEVKPVEFRVTVMPADCLEGRCPVAAYNELHHWCLYVALRRQGWVVTSGGRDCLGRDGTWDWPPADGSEDERAAFEANCVFGTALAATAIAREHAPVMTINNVVAADKLARHMRAHRAGRREAEYE